MKEINHEIMKTIEDRQFLHFMKKQNAREIGSKDEFGFSFEPFDAFSMEPLTFAETAMKLHTEAVETFSMIRELNRHSPLFYSLSSQLEKLFTQLGSACITKALIEQQEGQKFRLLQGLTVEWLRERVAFNFRKCYSSFMESDACFHHNAQALALSLRWSALDKRLLATAEKINKIKAGELTVDLTDKAETLKDHAESMQGQPEAKKESTAPLSPDGRALPIDKSAVREALGAEAVLEHPEAETQPSESRPAAVAELPEPEAAAEMSDSQPAAVAELPEPEAERSPASENQDAPGTAEIPGPAAETAEQSGQTEETDIITEEDLGENYLDEEGYYDDEVEGIPCVSEGLAQRMSEMYNAPELIGWMLPEYAPP